MIKCKGSVTKMRIAVCDDIKGIRMQISSCIKEYNDKFEVYEYADGADLLSAKEQFDLIFLDIEMPGKDGMLVAKEIRERKDDVKIVFLTSHDERIYDAFEVRAFRFLKKPIEKRKLNGVLYHVEDECLQAEKIVIIQKGKIYSVNLQDVVYLEAFGDGTFIYDKWNRVYESLEQLKVWEKRLLGRDFFRIHRSYIISMRHVKEIVNGKLLLEGWKKPLTVSKRKISEFKDKYLQFIKEKARTL